MSIERRVISSERIYQGRVVGLRVDTVEEDGAQTRIEIVEHRGSFAIAPVTASGGVVLVRQYRHAAGAELWEIPAGTAETGEDALAGARRELREETGYTAERLQEICNVYPTPGYAAERVHIYAAYGLQAGEQQLDEDERIDVAEFSLDRAWSMQASGTIADMKTVLALLWLLRERDKFVT